MVADANARMILTAPNLDKDKPNYLPVQIQTEQQQLDAYAKLPDSPLKAASVEVGTNSSGCVERAEP